MGLIIKAGSCRRGTSFASLVVSSRRPSRSLERTISSVCGRQSGQWEIWVRVLFLSLNPIYRPCFSSLFLGRVGYGASLEGMVSKISLEKTLFLWRFSVTVADLKILCSFRLF